MPRPVPYTDDELRAAVRVSQTLFEVCTRLDLVPGGKTYKALRRSIAIRGLDTSHMSAAAQRAAVAQSRRQWSDDELRDVAASSRSVSEVLRRLGYQPNGGMHRWIKARFTILGIDTSHFTGQAWSAGLDNPSGKKRLPLSEVLVAGSTYSSATLRRRLIADGLKPPHCEVCGLADWRGAPLSLALDHINGVPTDNRIENLRILCPNCHSQTDTWCGRNRTRAKPAYSNRQRGQV